MFEHYQRSYITMTKVISCGMYVKLPLSDLKDLGPAV